MMEQSQVPGQADTSSQCGDVTRHWLGTLHCNTSLFVEHLLCTFHTNLGCGKGRKEGFNKKQEFYIPKWEAMQEARGVLDRSNAHYHYAVHTAQYRLQSIFYYYCRCRPSLIIWVNILDCSYFQFVLTWEFPALIIYLPAPPLKTDYPAPVIKIPRVKYCQLLDVVCGYNNNYSSDSFHAGDHVWW